MKTMRVRIGLAWIGFVALAISAAAQTAVTTTGGTSSTVPIFTGSATVGNSPISVSGSNVGIGTTSPSETLTVFGSESLNGNLDFQVSNVRIAVVTGPGTITVGDDDNVSLANGLLYVNSGASRVGIGTTNPLASLHISKNGSATEGYGLVLGQNANGGNYSVPVGSETARFEIAFPTFRDVEPNQIGAKIAAIRWNNYTANNAAIQAVDLAFFTGLGTDGGGTSSLIDTSSEKMRITASGRVGIGTTAPGARLEVNGGIKLTASSGGSITFQDGSIQTVAYTGVTCGGDYAESVDVTGERTKYEAGDVLVIDSDASGKFLKSAEPYSTSVSGVYSTKPGTVGRRQITPKSDAEVPMAMVGIVPTKVTAENGPIHRGDLLVTSSRIGFAMKGTDRSRMLGAVIGKALDNLESGTGVIEVVVTLQ